MSAYNVRRKSIIHTGCQFRLSHLLVIMIVWVIVMTLMNIVQNVARLRTARFFLGLT